MHLLNPSGGATRMADRVLSLITSYENGTVKLWQYRNIEKERSIEGLGWECLWSFKQHVESGKRVIVCLLVVSFNSHIYAIAMTVMATTVSLDRSIALSVSADHLIGRYDLKVCGRLTRHLNCMETNKHTPGGSDPELGDCRNGVPNETSRKWRRGVPRRWTGMCHRRLGRPVRAQPH